MAYQDDRPMFEVNIDCAECGKKITELPFEPTSGRDVFCSDCLRAKRGNNRRDGRGSDRGGRGSDRGERRMYDVDVNCADCGTHISQLPFQPRSDGDIYCFDCNKKRRG